MAVSVTENTARAWSERSDRVHSWEAAGWSEHGQVQRFAAVRRHLELRDGDTVLDYGCGTGAFSAYLPAGVSYVGFDQAEGMRERACRDHPSATIVDRLDPLDPGFQHVVAIGPFNLPGSLNATLVELQKLWECTEETLIVSLYRGTDERCISYDAADVLDTIARLTTRWQIDASYLDNDFLAVLHR